MSVVFRLTIYEANGSTVDFTLTSIRSGTNPYITGVPSGDGQEVDLLTGSVRSGAYVVEVADVATGTDATGTIRIVTSNLEDNKFRQQLLSRRAKLECSRNNGSTWDIWTFGYLTNLRQTDAITYAFTVSDSRRIEATHTAFTWSANPNAATDEQREFPNRGCLAGGPTIESFGPIRASGGWEYAWQEVQGRLAALNFIAAYNPPSWARNSTIEVIPYFNALRPFLQTLPPIANVTGANFAQLRDRQYVYGSASVQAIITAGASKWTGTVRGAHTPPSPAQNGQGAATVPRFGDMNFMYIDLDPGQSTSYPSQNTIVRVQLIQKKVSEISPLYIAEHPVDIVTKLYDTVNIPYDSASATAVKALIGDDLRLALRITAPVVLGKFLADSIFGPFGFSARTNASGEQEFFTTRIARSATPTIAIADADIVGDTPPPIFELEEASVVTSFRLTTKALTPFLADPTQGAQAPPDGIIETEITEIVENGDVSTFSTREVAYSFPGMLYSNSTSTTAFTLSPEVVGSFFTGILAEGFDRFGRGAVASEVQVLASSNAAALQVGDEVLISASYYPNKNYRIGESNVGSRIAQIVRRTEAPEGPIFKLIDSGVNAQPTAPTFTVAADAGDPRRVAAVTVTNAATLNASEITLAVQYQVSANTPTKTGTLYTRFRPGTIPTVAFTLPPVLPGSKVWVRMRTERTEYRASAWTAWTSVTLDAWVAPASLTVGTTTANSVALSWSLGSPTANTIDPIDVFAYQGASAPADWTPYRIGSLSNGSTSTTIRNLDASTQYTFGVAFKDEASGGYSTFATATTTTAATNTVSAPAAPKMKVYTSFPNAGQSTGVALAIGAIEGYNIVVQRAPNSSGSPGTWEDIALLPPLTPIFVDPLPSDGVTRWYRVFYRLSGFLDGSAGTARSATPIAIPDDLIGQNSSIISGGATLTFGAYLVGTPDNFYDGATSQSLAVDATSASTANKVVARDNTGSFSANTVTATLNGPAPAGQLTGDTLAANVVTSSLTSVGTIGTGTWQGTSVGKNYGGTGLTSTAFTGITNERVFAYDGGSGSFFIAPSGSNGQALVYSGGALAWGNPAPGSHVLADTTGLGSQHTTSGLTAGMILQATGATTARFQTPSIPASSVTAGTFSGASYTITNDLTVSGTLTGTLTGNITGNAATVTNGVYTTGSYADPSWITSLAGSKISGNISGSAANVTGTVAIANGGTNATSYGTSGSGTRAIVYDIGTNAFEAVAAGTSGQFLQSAGNAGDITWATPPNFNSTTAGYAPASGGGTSNFLRADGTWAVPSVGSVSANNVTAGTFSGANYYFTNNVRFDSGARVAFGYGYTIDNAGGSPVSVLTATTLGAGVVNSSLTSVGTLTSGALGAGFTAIDNARLANSSITINGTSVSLGGSITVDTSKWTASGSNIYYSTGNVSIGTTPSSSIELYVRGGGSTSSTYGFLVENSSATSTFWVNDAGNVSIPNGNLGIGTSPTSTRLTVGGGATVNGLLSVATGTTGTTATIFGATGRGIYFGQDGGGNYIEANGTTAATRVLRIQAYDGTSVYTSLSFDPTNSRAYFSSASLGIGTTAPNGVLELVGGTAMTGGWNRTQVLQATFPVLVFNSNGSKFGGIGYDYSSTTYGLTFWVNGSSLDVSGTASEVLRLMQNGYVYVPNRIGLGTQSPNVSLEVNGLARFTGTGGFSIGEDAAQNRIRTISGSRFAFYNSSDVLTGLAIRSLGVGATYGTIATPTSGAIIEGFVGIGTSSPISSLDLRGSHTGGYGILNIVSTDNALISVDSSSVYDTGLRLKYQTVDKWLVGIRGSDSFTFGNASDVRILTITQSGNVGINTTSPGRALTIASGEIGLTQGFGITWNSGDNYIKGVAGYALQFTTYDGGSSQNEVMRLTGGTIGAGGGATALFGTTVASTTGGFTNTRMVIKQIADGGTGGGLHIEQNSNTNVAYFGFTGSAFRIGTSYRSTGSYQPMEFYTGPTVASSMILNTSGWLGIGTSSPEAKLEVDVGAPTNAVGIYLDTDGSGGAVGIGVGSSVGPYLVGNTRPDGTARGAYGAARMGFNAFGFSFDYSSTTSGSRVWSTYAVINSSGNVGIGTTSPASMLHLNGTDPILRLQDSAGGDVFGMYVSDTLGLGVFNFTDSRQDFTISGAGNIGIGTTSPNQILHLRSSAPYIRMERAGGANTYVGSDSIGMYVGSGEAVPIYFNTNNTERMRIHPTNAWVGIGVTNPDVALSVNGFVHIGNGGNYLYMGGTAGSSGSWGSRHSTSSGNHLINANSFKFDNVGYGSTWAVEFTSGGNTLIGAQTGWASGRLQVGTTSTSAPAAEFNGTGNTSGLSPVYIWNNVESGSTYFISFYSDGQNNARTLRGYINYRRDNATMNLTTASDYRIKTIHGAYTKSGEVFDKIQVHEGTINGESGKYPMVLAHELQEAYPSAVDGEKDAVNEDGTPKLQMVSYVAMIPVMLAEIKSLRERVAQLEKQ